MRLKKARLPGALATIVKAVGSSPRKTGAKMLVYGDGAISGTIGGGKTEAETIAAALQVMGSGAPRSLSFALTEEHGHVCGGNVTIYLEPVTVSPVVFVVGAGHVGRAVARAAGEAGFLVTLIDTAGGKADFTAADEVRRCATSAELTTLFRDARADGHAFIFISTSDHQEDFTAAAASLATTAGYIGVLGSARKRQAMELYLQGKGFGGEDIKRIISPAGLDIKAETPEEIAVSVVAQMILHRRSAHAAHCRDRAGRGSV